MVARMPGPVLSDLNTCPPSRVARAIEPLHCLHRRGGMTITISRNSKLSCLVILMDTLAVPATQAFPYKY